MGPVGAAALAEALRQHNFRLRALYVNHEPRIGDAGCASLCRTISDFFFGRYGHLRTLSLRETGMGDAACKALGENLELNVRLTTLRLECNRITSRGAAALARGLAENKVIVELDLSENKVGAEGFAALGRALATNARLQRLHVADNLATDGGAHALLAALTPRASAQARLRGGGKGGGKGAGKGAAGNSTLLHLRARGNPIRPHLVARLEACCARNRGHRRIAAQSERSGVLADPGSLHAPTKVHKSTSQKLTPVGKPGVPRYFDAARGMYVTREELPVVLPDKSGGGGGRLRRHRRGRQRGRSPRRKQRKASPLRGRGVMRSKSPPGAQQGEGAAGGEGRARSPYSVRPRSPERGEW